MKRLFIPMMLVLLAISACEPVYAADCEKALFGWELQSGKHVSGTLANEGVSKKNPRGFQALKNDRGNYRNGKFCGGTAYGWSCKALPGKYDVKTLSREQAILLYHDNQWAEMRGDEFQGQYLAYKIFDVGVNCGEGSAALCLVDTVNTLNGTATDFRRKPVVTADMVVWINAFTKSDILPDYHNPRFPGDYGPGGHDSTRRKLFITTFKDKVLQHYGNIIAKNPKMGRWWETWKKRLEEDE